MESEASLCLAPCPLPGAEVDARTSTQGRHSGLRGSGFGSVAQTGHSALVSTEPFPAGDELSPTEEQA